MVDAHRAACCFRQQCFVVAGESVLDEYQDVGGNQANRDNRKALGRIVILDGNHAISIGEEEKPVESVCIFPAERGSPMVENLAGK